MNKNTPRVCIIGAGCSGLAAIKNCLQAGIENVVCFEQNDQLGGNWVFTAQESHSSVCETTHMISSKKLSEYLDFPMPEEYPDYPSHAQVLKYFQSYAKHFGLNKYIQFNTSVLQALKLENEGWEIFLNNGKSQIVDYLWIANGHHSVPRHPEFKSDFKGEYLHSHNYKNNKAFENKRVLVVGAGNSGCDCAVEISRVAESVAISIRTPQYIVPKFFLGKPADTFNEKLLWMPKPIARFIRKQSLKLQVGSYTSYGLQEPQHDILKAHPTLNSELLYKIRHGKVHPRVGIEKIDGQKVYFKNGLTEKFDVLLAATGYKIATPFLDSDLLDYSESDTVPLYLKMFHPNHPTLVFIGLTQPQGAIWPLSDLQSKLAANYVIGNWKLPQNISELAKSEAKETQRMFLKRKRHAIEVHYHPFAKKIKKQIPSLAPEWGEIGLSIS